MPDLNCTTCGHKIEAGRKYLVIFLLGWGGFRLEVGCDHHEVEGAASADAVFGSGGCFARWLEDWSRALDPCNHGGSGNALDKLTAPPVH